MACHPTGVLRDEHRLILRVVDAMAVHLDAGRRPGARELFGRCVRFFRLYTDALHHGKEEDLLFEALIQEGMPRHVGPVAIMLQDHQLGRALVRQMEENLEAIESEPDRWRGFDNAARTYVELIHMHIGKENHGLFETADRILDEPTCRRLCDAYDGVCAREFDGSSMRELERLAEEIIATAV